jgi:hypothetical protein
MARRVKGPFILMAILAALSRPAFADCTPFGDHSTCTVGKTLAWIVTSPLWLPLVPFAYLARSQEEKEQQAAQAWKNMTHEEREEAIQLQQLQLQRQQQQLQNTDMLLRAWQATQPQQPQTTTCNPNISGGFDCTQR